ncbi:MAG: DNA mismatch repair endonuclease MutL [Bacteroidetes bacterium]|nr:MAG: DNA mismatch repair endonuclease MutL [Bacteroidota bacterium]
MSDIIKLLPDHVANQIAAGEVIQRPASVVKELLDNAIDAGASSIQLVIKEGGKTWIQVIDNGKGMSPTDARMCWERHATSKINSSEDIYTIKTMGFRGEALASIASVAQVELKTKSSDYQVGTLILVEGSEVKKQEEAACEQGTGITVKNLFYNIPARRNFLKSNPVETRHIFDEFTRAALANPSIRFTLHNNNDEVYLLDGGDIQLRIKQLFGYGLPEQLLALSEETTIANVSGFMGKPELVKKTRGEQFFFVNGRFIKDAYLNHAVMSCYENLITKDQFPFYVIFIEIDPKHIDVNVHPSKTEIKFDDERSLYQILKSVCKKTIGEHYHVPTFEPSSPDYFLQLHTPNQPINSPQQTPPPAIKQGNNNQGFNTTNHNFNQTKSSDWEELFGILNKKETIADVGGKRFAKMPDELELETDAYSKNITQIHGTFILSQIKSGIMLIDMQAAHERILFNKYMYALQNQPMVSQQKLFPKSITLNAADALLLQELLADIRALGFDVNELGGNAFSINGVPAELNHYNEQHLIDEVLEHYKQQHGNQTKHQHIAKILAQRAAIKPGTRLNTEEMNNLIDELFALPENKLSPSGKVCYKTLRLDDIYKILI